MSVTDVELPDVDGPSASKARKTMPGNEATETCPASEAPSSERQPAAPASEAPAASSSLSPPEAPASERQPAHLWRDGEFALYDRVLKTLMDKWKAEKYGSSQPWTDELVEEFCDWFERTHVLI